MPRVAVITPTYNRGHNGLLEKTMLSVAGQSYGDFVHIIVDDGSTDNTQDIVNSYAADDNRIAYYRRERDAQQRFGASAAINFGIARLADYPHVEFVTFLHSDDLYARDNLKRKIEALDNAGVRAVYSWVGIFRKGHPLWINKGPDTTNSQDLASQLKDGFGVDFPNHSFVLTRKLLGEVVGFDEKIACGEDRDFSIRILDRLNEGELIVLPETLHYYRIHEDTVSNYCRGDGTARSDFSYLARKHSKPGINSALKTAKYFLMRPHALLPESVKRQLRPIRDAVKSRREFQMDPFAAQIEAYSAVYS